MSSCADHTVENQVCIETDLSTLNLADTSQDDYPMTGAFDLQSELERELMLCLGPEDYPLTLGFSFCDEDPLDYQFGAFHMLILDRLSMVSSNYLTQVTNDPQWPTLTPYHWQQAIANFQTLGIFTKPTINPPWTEYWGLPKPNPQTQLGSLNQQPL